MTEELKTLKDLKKYHLEHSVNYGDDVSTMEEGEGFGDYSYYREEDLKAEAIKWVKKLKKDIHRYADNGMDFDIFAADVTRKWIIQFFNLTEEDLK